MSDRLEGEVVLWRPQPRGFGFVIVPGRAVKYFCHVLDVAGHQDLPVGTRVSFTLATDGRGRTKAVNVCLTDGPIETGANVQDT